MTKERESQLETMEIIEFARVVGKLKKTKRSGWVNYELLSGESVAEHSFRMTVLAMFLAPKFKVNQDKVIKMSLIHDLGEAEIGDVVTMHGRKVLGNLKEKVKKERKALMKILSIIDAKEYIKLFDEFEENKTKEARFVRQLDKLEVAIQALEYEEEHKLNLEEFFEYADETTSDKQFKEILNHLQKLRKK